MLSVGVMHKIHTFTHAKLGVFTLDCPSFLQEGFAGPLDDKLGYLSGHSDLTVQ